MTVVIVDLYARNIEAYGIVIRANENDLDRLTKRMREADLIHHIAVALTSPLTCSCDRDVGKNQSGPPDAFEYFGDYAPSEYSCIHAVRFEARLVLFYPRSNDRLPGPIKRRSRKRHRDENLVDKVGTPVGI